MDDQIPNPIKESSAVEVESGNADGQPPPSSIPVEVEGSGRQVRIYPWLGGAILILLGVVFLLQNLGLPFLENWWALFILIPALYCFSGAWNSYQRYGRLRAGAVGTLAGGVLLTLLSLSLLFNLDLGMVWPLFLIAGGLIILGTALWPKGK